MDLFGGDLIAFCAAVVQRGPESLAIDWALSPEHAVDYVRERYLDRLDPEGRATLLRVAALSSLELTAPPSIATPGNVDTALEEGLLQRAEADGGLLTVHPGVGSLLLAAGGLDTPPCKLLQEIAELDAERGLHAARTLTETHPECAETIWAAVIESNPTALVTADPHSMPWTLRRIFGGNVWNADRLDDLLAADPAMWEEALRSARPETISSILGITRTLLPRTFEVVSAQIRVGRALQPWVVDTLTKARGPGVAVLAQHIASMWPGTLDEADARLAATDYAKDFVDGAIKYGFGRSARATLQILPRVLPRTAAVTWHELASRDESEWRGAVRATSLSGLQALRPIVDESALAGLDAAIADPEFGTRVAERAVRQDPAILGSRLQALRRVSPTAHNYAATFLAESGAGTSLATRFLKRSFAGLPGLLAHADTSVRAFLEEMSAELLRSDNTDRFRAAVMRTSPQVLAELLPHAQRMSEAFRLALVDALADPSRAAAYASRLCQSPTPTVARFAGAGSAVLHVLEAIDPEEWAHGRAVEDVVADARDFPALAASLHRAGRNDLAKIAALSLAEQILADRASEASLPVAALSHILRLAGNGDDVPGRRLAHIALSPQRVVESIYREPPDALAQALFSMYHYEPAAASRFNVPELDRRTADELVDAQSWRALEAALQLAGAAALVGRPISTHVAQSVNAARVSEVVAHRAAQDGPATPAEMQVWLGVRELANAPVHFSYDPAAVRRRVELWRSTNVTQRHAKTIDDLAKWIGDALLH